MQHTAFAWSDQIAQLQQERVSAELTQAICYGSNSPLIVGAIRTRRLFVGTGRGG